MLQRSGLLPSCPALVLYHNYFIIVNTCSCLNHTCRVYTFNDYNHYIYFTTCIQLANGLSTHLLHSFKFTLVNKSHLYGYCLRHFLILYACVHEVSFPDQKTTVNGLEARLVTKWPAGSTLGWHGLFPLRRSVKQMYYRDGALPIC